MNPKVDAYLRKAKKWQPEMEKLRSLLLDSPMTEEFKWGKPCYTFNGSNLFVILALKDYITLLFCKGSLLKDAKKILTRPSENTQAARQLRFTGLEKIVELESVVKSYIREAIAAEKTGLQVTYKKITEHKVPGELQRKLDTDAKFKTAFKALTPGRQRAYMLHFSSAKQSETREARIKKCTPDILKGIGFNERYKSQQRA
jgi:uncharacterized protein YdeI (YjbR/CyaY-like superfamily)